MIDSLPFLAPSTPPETGASRNPMPCSASSALADLAVSEATVEWSTTTLPGASTVDSALTFSSTSASAETQSTTTSQSAKSAGVSAALTCASAANCCAFAKVRLPTTPSNPCACKCPASEWPMAPSPMNPTRISVPSYSWACFVQVGVAGQAGFERRQHPRRLGRVEPGAVDLGAVGVAQVVQLVADVVEHHVGGVAAALAATACSRRRRSCARWPCRCRRTGCGCRRGSPGRRRPGRCPAGSSRHACSACSGSELSSVFDSDVGVDACRRNRRSGRRSRRAASGCSSRRSIGTIGNTWSIAQTSGIDSNTREIDEVLVDQALVQFVEHLAMALLVAGQARAHARGRWRRTGRRARALDQVELAERVQRLAFGHGVLRLVVQLQRRARVELGVESRAGGGSPRGSSACAPARAPSGARSTSDTLTTSTAWCAVIARPASVIDARRRQAVLVAGLGQRLHDACARTGPGRS